MILLAMQGTEEGFPLMTQEQQPATNGPKLWKGSSLPAEHCAAKRSGQRYESDRFLPWHRWRCDTTYMILQQIEGWETHQRWHRAKPGQP